MAIRRHGGPAGEGGQGHRWFIVANGSRGRAYVQRVGSPGYDVVREWDEPNARAHDRDLGEDRPGRLFAAAGAAQRSAIERDAKDDSPKEHARRDLMHAIAQDVAAALRGREATGVVLVAPTTMLRALKAAMPHDLQPAILGEHGADLTQLPTAEVFERLDALRRGG
jgi:hypothetical protein